MAEEQKTERVQLLMTLSEVKAVDEWSFSNRVRGRSEAIRRLIELGLAAAAREQTELQ
jgi:metal-responsive CopG/Arc/MetJ family transcriptional regulator